MNKTYARGLVALSLIGFSVVVAGSSTGAERAQSPVRDAREPAPQQLVLSADGTTATVTERGTDSVARISLTQGTVIARAKTGRHPDGIALLPSGGVVVTNYDDDTLTVFDTNLKPVATVAVGGEPRGVAVDAKTNRAYVALAGEDAVAVVDLATNKVLRRLTTGTEPWSVLLSADGKKLLVGCTRSREVQRLDLATGETDYSVLLFGHNVRELALSTDGAWAYVPFITERGRPVTRENIDIGWVVGNRLGRVPLTEDGPREAITLDIRGEAVGDVEGCTLSPNGTSLALSAGGTHEVLLFRDAPKLPFVAYGGPGDHIEPATKAQLTRIALGGRPLGLRFTPDGKTLVVANDLANAVHVIDVASANVVRTISLGGSAVPSLARRGEALFHDAKRSFHAWYSCATCHTDGHTNGGSFDTFNDGGYGKPKKTLSLRGVAETAPYTWHGWQTSLTHAIRESFVKSMQGEEPTDDDVTAVAAYLKTLSWRKSPYPGSTPAAQRGKILFTQKGCDTCHSGPNFTSPMIVKAGLEEPDDAYVGYNPPPLRNVYARAPYLHDGRAGTLDSLLREHHRPSQLTGKPDCTPAERDDLVAYLKSL